MAGFTLPVSHNMPRPGEPTTRGRPGATVAECPIGHPNLHSTPRPDPEAASGLHIDTREPTGSLGVGMCGHVDESPEARVTADTSCPTRLTNWHVSRTRDVTLWHTPLEGATNACEAKPFRFRCFRPTSEGADPRDVPECLLQGEKQGGVRERTPEPQRGDRTNVRSDGRGHRNRTSRG